MAEIATIGPLTIKLQKLIPRLATNHDGEVVATVRAVDRALKGAGLDFHDLAGALAATPPPSRQRSSCEPKATRSAPKWCRLTDQERTDWLDRLLASHGLTPWEEGFCRDIRNGILAWPGARRSDKQKRILDGLIAAAWEAWQ